MRGMTKNELSNTSYGKKHDSAKFCGLAVQHFFIFDVGRQKQASHSSQARTKDVSISSIWVRYSSFRRFPMKSNEYAWVCAQRSAYSFVLYKTLQGATNLLLCPEIKTSENLVRRRPSSGVWCTTNRKWAPNPSQKHILFTMLIFPRKYSIFSLPGPWCNIPTRHRNACVFFSKMRMQKTDVTKRGPSNMEVVWSPKYKNAFRIFAQ